MAVAAILFMATWCLADMKGASQRMVSLYWSLYQREVDLAPWMSEMSSVDRAGVEAGGINSGGASLASMV